MASTSHNVMCIFRWISNCQVLLPKQHPLQHPGPKQRAPLAFSKRSKGAQRLSEPVWHGPPPHQTHGSPPKAESSLAPLRSRTTNKSSVPLCSITRAKEKQMKSTRTEAFDPQSRKGGHVRPIHAAQAVQVVFDGFASQGRYLRKPKIQRRIDKTRPTHPALRQEICVGLVIGNGGLAAWKTGRCRLTMPPSHCATVMPASRRFTKAKLNRLQTSLSSGKNQETKRHRKLVACSQCVIESLRSEIVTRSTFAPSNQSQRKSFKTIQ